MEAKHPLNTDIFNKWAQRKHKISTGSRPVGDAGWYNVSNADGISSADSCGGKLNAE